MNKSVFALLCITGITCGAMAAADPDGLVAAYDFTDAQDGLVRDYGPNANPAILHSFTGKTSDALCREPGGKQVFRGDGNGNFFLQECVTVCDPCGWNHQREWVTVRTHRSAADAVDDMCGLMKADLKEVVAYASSPSIHPATIEE